MRSLLVGAKSSSQDASTSDRLQSAKTSGTTTKPGATVLPDIDGQGVTSSTITTELFTAMYKPTPSLSMVSQLTPSITLC